MADATQQQRLVLPVGTQAAVEGETATLGEALLGIDSTNSKIGYSTDSGTNWAWPGLSAADVEAAGYWSPLTNGDATTPELVFADGDTISVWTET